MESKCAKLAALNIGRHLCMNASDSIAKDVTLIHLHKHDKKIMNRDFVTGEWINAVYILFTIF